MDEIKSEATISSTIVIDHTYALISLSICLPIITILLLRDWYIQREDEESSFDQAIRGAFCFITFIAAVATYCKSFLTYENIFYNNLYLCSAAHITVLVIQLLFGYKNHVVKWGTKISHFGTILGFITVAAMYTFGECKMLNAMYIASFCIFLFGCNFVIHVGHE